MKMREADWGEKNAVHLCRVEKGEVEWAGEREQVGGN